jgi:hypothetical protein
VQKLIFIAWLWGPAAALAQVPSAADYQSWLAIHGAEVAEFDAFLVQQSAAQILPTEQVLRTATSWRTCTPKTPFEVPPKAYWPRAVATLRVIRDEVVPRIGQVEAVSGYRNDILNPCVSKAKQSAHRGFWGFDLIPLTSIKKTQVERRLCDLHRTKGEQLQLGLGFYTGERFHVDTKGFRRWGANGKSATSPCTKY